MVHGLLNKIKADHHKLLNHYIKEHSLTTKELRDLSCLQPYYKGCNKALQLQQQCSQLVKITGQLKTKQAQPGFKTAMELKATLVEVFSLKRHSRFTSRTCQVQGYLYISTPSYGPLATPSKVSEFCLL